MRFLSIKTVTVLGSCLLEPEYFKANNGLFQNYVLKLVKLLMLVNNL